MSFAKIYGVDSGSDEEIAWYDEALASDQQESTDDQPGIASDIGYSVTSAANQALAGLSRTADTFIGDGSDSALTKRLDLNAEYGNQQLSEEQQLANQEEFVTEDDQGNYGVGGAWTNPRSLMNVAARGAGSIGPTIVGGGLLARAAMKGVGAIAGTQALATKVAGAAAYGAAETAMVTGGVSGEVQKGVQAMPEDIIVTNERYQELYWDKVNSDVDDKTAREEARNELGLELGKQGMKDVALPSFIAGTAAGHFLNKFMTGKLEGTRLARTGKGIAAEAPTEGVQGATEHYVTQDQLSQVDTSINPMRGTFNAGVAEAAGGMAIGGAMGGLSRGNQNNSNSDNPQQDAEVPLELGYQNKLDFNREKNPINDDIVFADGTTESSHSFYQRKLAEHGDANRARDETYQALNRKDEQLMLPPKTDINAGYDESLDDTQRAQAKKDNQVSLINSPKQNGLRQRPSMLRRDVDNDVSLINNPSASDFKETPTKQNERDQAYSQFENINKEAEIDQEFQQRESQRKEKRRRDINDAIENIDITKKGRKALRKFMRNNKITIENRKEFIGNLGFEVKLHKDNANESGELTDTTFEHLLKKAFDDKTNADKSTVRSDGAKDTEQNNTQSDGANEPSIVQNGVPNQQEAIRDKEGASDGLIEPEQQEMGATDERNGSGEKSSVTHEDEHGEQYTSVGDGNYKDANGEIWAFDDNELTVINDTNTGAQSVDEYGQTEAIEQSNLPDDRQAFLGRIDDGNVINAKDLQSIGDKGVNVTAGKLHNTDKQVLLDLSQSTANPQLQNDQPNKRTSEGQLDTENRKPSIKEDGGAVDGAELRGKEGANNSVNESKQQPMEAAKLNEQKTKKSQEAKVAEKPAKESVDEILTQTKGRYISAQLRKQQIKKSSPGYPAAKAKAEQQYEADLERAEVSLPLDEYKKLPVNKGQSEPLLTQAYNAIRDDLGISDESELKVSNKIKNTKRNGTLNGGEGRATNDSSKKKSPEIGINKKSSKEQVDIKEDVSEPKEGVAKPTKQYNKVQDELSQDSVLKLKSINIIDNNFVDEKGNDIEIHRNAHDVMQKIDKELDALYDLIGCMK